MKFKKFVSNFDYIIFISSIILTVIGIMFIYSANFNKSQELQTQFVKQMIFFIISLGGLIGILFSPERSLKKFSVYIYLVCILGLIITLFFPEVKGQRRFNILFFSVQFSEFMKIGTILFLSSYLAEKSSYDIRKLSIFLTSVMIVGIPMALILLQPDLGTMLVYIPIFFSIAFISGMKKRYILYALLLIFFISFIPVSTSINKLFYNNESQNLSLLTNFRYVITIYMSLSIILLVLILSYFNIIIKVSERFKRYFYWLIFFLSVIFIGLLISYPVNYFILKPYQKDRLMIFFNPESDPLDKGYNIIQSETTIGNGGLLGKGWCKGEQIQNFFLPEQATDFIFPVIAEEKGFMGSLLLLFLYSLIFYRGYYIILNAKNYIDSYIIVGILSMFLFHIIENIGMTVGIMPITGIPLPFLSYGGSFLITCFVAVGIIMNIHLNRYRY